MNLREGVILGLNVLFRKLANIFVKGQVGTNKRAYTGIFKWPRVNSYKVEKLIEIESAELLYNLC